MANDDLENLKLLESARNVRTLFQVHRGRGLSASIAREIAICVQQGREFYELARTASLTVRPLIQYYGLVALSKALLMWTRECRLSALPQSHGLKDRSGPESGIEGLRAEIGAAGTFSQFNDAVGATNRIVYLNWMTLQERELVPVAATANLAGMTIGIEDVLSRVDELQNLYADTFQSEPHCTNLGYLISTSEAGNFTLDLNRHEALQSRDDLRRIVDAVRRRYPYLARWRVTHARMAYGAARISFANSAFEGDDLAPEVLNESDGPEFTPLPVPAVLDAPRIFPPSRHLAGVGGGFGNTMILAIEPINNEPVFEYSLQYIGMFLLGSMVRYRPDVWQHALSRAFSPDLRADDRALALVERFLSVNADLFPGMIHMQLNSNQERRL